MVQGIWFVIYYFVNFMGTIVKAGVTVYAQLFVTVVAHVPAAAWSVEVSPAKFLVSLDFKWQFYSSLRLPVSFSDLKMGQAEYLVPAEFKTSAKLFVSLDSGFQGWSLLLSTTNTSLTIFCDNA
jgi:hypothetical protein